MVKANRNIKFTAIGLFVILSLFLSSIFVLAAPSISSVDLTSSTGNNYTTDNLTASSSGVVDSTDILYEWYKGNVLSFTQILDNSTDSVLDSSYTSVSETWYINATAYGSVLNDDISSGTLEDTYNFSSFIFGQLTDIEVSENGQYLYITTNQGMVYQTEMSKRWNVSTASYVQELNLSSYGVVGDLQFVDGGRRFLFIGNNEDLAYMFNLSSAYNITTGVEDTGNNLNFSSYFGNAGGIHISPDGFNFYITRFTNPIYQFNLSTAFDLTTATEVDSFTPSGQKQSLMFNRDGSRFYISKQNDGSVEEYSMDRNWNVSNATLLATLITNTSSGAFGVYYAEDVAKLYVSKREDNQVEQFSIGTSNVGTRKQSNSLTIVAIPSGGDTVANGLNFAYRFANNEAGSCNSGLVSSATEIFKADFEYSACSCLKSSNGNDELAMSMKVGVPADASGNKLSTIVFTAYVSPDGC